MTLPWPFGGKFRANPEGMRKYARCEDRGTLPSMATANPLPHVDPVLAALDRAPLVVDVSEEALAEVHQRAEDIRSGRVRPREHGAVQQTIAEMRKLAAG